jgi:hypothetical protein
MRNLRNETLSRFLAAPGRFGIYGTGDTAEAVFRTLAEQGLKASAFLDGDRMGEWLGLEILPPEEALGLDLVVTAGSHARDMTVQLRADGFEGPVLDLSAAHRADAAAWFDEALLNESADAIGFARSLLHDEASRDAFDAVLRYRRLLDPGELPPAPPDLGHPEMPVAEGEWMLVMGAGEDECLALADSVGPLGRIHVLEPDPQRGEAVQDAADASALGARLTIHPLACGACCHAPTGAGEETAPVVTVDEFVWGTTSGRVDRLLIAGGNAEEILEGASATLSEHRPQLAVDLAAAPAGLWEIPIQLKEGFAGCRLHLLHHSQGLAATRAYARPSEKR